ncbi:hypothetical protein GCM10018790_62640 [Kitasatospora xanthocidica]|nr:hypothetical protein GCM10018790_62640 [Kitasatospora xanthocidica]
MPAGSSLRAARSSAVLCESARSEPEMAKTLDALMTVLLACGAGVGAGGGLPGAGPVPGRRSFRRREI